MSFDPPTFGNTTAKGTPSIGKNAILTMGSQRVRKLVVTTAAAGAVDGTALTTQPVITLTDVFGNTITTDNSTVVDASVFLGNGQCAGTTTATCSSGVATFSGLTVESFGTPVNITIKYHAPGAVHVIQDAGILEAAGAAVSAAITRAPVGATSGSPLSVQPVVTLYDSDGAVANSTINVVAAKKSGTGTLSGTTTVAAVNGVATFTNLVMTTAGTYVLSFTPTSLTEVDSGTLTTS